MVRSKPLERDRSLYRARALGSQSVVRASDERGLVPAANSMASVKTALAQRGAGWDRFREFPTFAWISTSDASLNWQCRAGLVLSVLLFFGVAPAPAPRESDEFERAIDAFARIDNRASSKRWT